MDCWLKYQPHYLWSYLKIRTALVSLTSLLREPYGLHLALVLMRGLIVPFTHKKMKANQFRMRWNHVCISIQNTKWNLHEAGPEDESWDLSRDRWDQQEAGWWIWEGRSKQWQWLIRSRLRPGESKGDAQQSPETWLCWHLFLQLTAGCVLAPGEQPLRGLCQCVCDMRGGPGGTPRLMASTLCPGRGVLTGGEVYCIQAI